MSVFIISLVIVVVLLPIILFLIKKRWYWLMLLIAVVLFFSPVYSLYEAGKSTYWTFSGDGYWTRAILFIILDMPTFVLMGVIALSFVRTSTSGYSSQYEKYIAYIVMTLFFTRFIFHFLISDNVTYFYVRNHFGPSIYKEMSPHEINKDMNISKQLQVQYPEQMEYMLVSAYAKEIESIMNASTLDAATDASRRRDRVNNCIQDVFRRNDQGYLNSSYIYIRNTKNNVEYSVVNSYSRYQSYKRNIHHRTSDDNPEYIELCKDPSIIKIKEFLVQVSKIK